MYKLIALLVIGSCLYAGDESAPQQPIAFDDPEVIITRVNRRTGEAETTGPTSITQLPLAIANTLIFFNPLFNPDNNPGNREG